MNAGTNNIQFYIPFIKYMLGIILACYRDFENRVYTVHGAGAKSTSYDIVKACISERIGKFSKQEILALCPSLGSSSVESALKNWLMKVIWFVSDQDARLGM